MEIGTVFEKLALGVEAAAVAVIVVGLTIATILYTYRLLRKHNATETFGDYRHGLARTLLLSLEFLVAADIVRTVAIEETSFERIGVLGLVILVRTSSGMARAATLWPDTGMMMKGTWNWPHTVPCASCSRTGVRR